MEKFVGLNDVGLRVGETHQHAKLTDHEIDLLIALRHEGWSYGELAGKFEVSKWCVRDIIKGRRRGQSVVAWRRVCVTSR